MRALPSPTRHSCRTLAFTTVGLWCACAAQAQWSGSVGADSDYRFRGVSLSGGKPSVRLTANYDAAAGWYAGAAATQAQVSQGERYAQVLGYAGYLRPVAGGSSIDFGATASVFIGSRRYDFAEAYAGLIFDRWSVRLNYAPDYFGGHVQTLYVDASGHLPLGNGFRVFGHAGLLAPLDASRAARSDAYAPAPDANRSRVDARVGLGWAVRDLDLNIAWSTVSRGGPFPAASAQRRSGWLLSATYFF